MINDNNFFQALFLLFLPDFINSSKNLPSQKHSIEDENNNEYNTTTQAVSTRDNDAKVDDKAKKKDDDIPKNKVS